MNKFKSMIYSVKIETVEPKAMRYRTVGDWFFTGRGCLTIQVADTGNWVYNMLVAVHELIEVILCLVAGISEKRVNAFDLTHQDDEDPGSHPKAPYHSQHITAMGIEMILAACAGAKWRIYEAALDRIYFKIPKRKKPL
jgi:hypothetical protein